VECPALAGGMSSFGCQATVECPGLAGGMSN